MTLLSPRPAALFNLTIDEETTLALLKHAHRVLPEDTLLAETWRVVEKMLDAVREERDAQYTLIVDAYTEGYLNGKDEDETAAAASGCFDDACEYARTKEGK